MLTMRRNWRIWRRGWCRCSLTWVASFFHRRCRWFATVHSPEGRLLPPSRLLHNCQSWTVNRTGVMTNHLYVSKKVANRIRAVDWHQFRWPWMTLNGRNAPFFTILHYIYRVFQCLLFKHPSAPHFCDHRARLSLSPHVLPNCFCTVHYHAGKKNSSVHTNL